MLIFRLGSMRLAVFLSRMMRLSYRVSDLGMGGCSLVLVSALEGWAIGHIFVLGDDSC